MKKRIITYRQKIDSLLANADNISPEQWNAILQEHLTQIFFSNMRGWYIIKTEAHLTTFEAISMIVGNSIGTGIIAAPYLATKNSMLDVVWMVLIAYCVNVILHLIIAELSYNNGGAQIFVNWFGMPFAAVPCILFAIFGVNSFIVLTRIMSGVVVLVSIMLVFTYGKSRKKAGSSPICGVIGTVPFQVLMVISTVLSAIGALIPLS